VSLGGRRGDGDLPFTHGNARLPLIETAAVTYRIVQRPSVIVILYENSPSVSRQIFLDERELPYDPNPTWLRYSVGPWEGDELVVNTVGFNDKTWLDALGIPCRDAPHSRAVPPNRFWPFRATNQHG
jgi:hypothetical protein